MKVEKIEQAAAEYRRIMKKLSSFIYYNLPLYFPADRRFTEKLHIAP